jgi:hypothetical protein
MYYAIAQGKTLVAVGVRDMYRIPYVYTRMCIHMYVCTMSARSSVWMCTAHVCVT